MGTIVFAEALLGAVGLELECGCVGAPGVVELVAFGEPFLALPVLAASVKLAQVRRVALAKCRVREPLPKKDPEPTRVEA